VRILDGVAQELGYPEAIQVDNGQEFISRAVGLADPLHLAFPDQRPCVSEWQAWQSVIKFSRQSCPNWLLAFKWCTSRFFIEPHC
jgi:hypothetical protein